MPEEEKNPEKIIAVMNGARPWKFMVGDNVLHNGSHLTVIARTRLLETVELYVVTADPKDSLGCSDILPGDALVVDDHPPRSINGWSIQMVRSKFDSFDPKLWERGDQAEDRLDGFVVTARHATAEIKSPDGPYRATVYFDNDSVRCFCTCPSMKKNILCKHMVAVVKKAFVSKDNVEIGGGTRFN